MSISPPCFLSHFFHSFFTTNTNTRAYIYLSLISKGFTISSCAKIKLNYISNFFPIKVQCTVIARIPLSIVSIPTQVCMHKINSCKDNFKTKLLEQIILIISVNLKVTTLILVLNLQSLAIQGTLLLFRSRFTRRQAISTEGIFRSQVIRKKE